jgi:hypothetical protein
MSIGEVTFTPEEQQAILADHERKRDRDMIIVLEARGYVVRKNNNEEGLEQRDLEYKTILEAKGYAVLKNDIDVLINILKSKGYKVSK